MFPSLALGRAMVGASSPCCFLMPMALMAEWWAAASWRRRQGILFVGLFDVRCVQAPVHCATAQVSRTACWLPRCARLWLLRAVRGLLAENFYSGWPPWDSPGKVGGKAEELNVVEGLLPQRFIMVSDGLGSSQLWVFYSMG